MLAKVWWPIAYQARIKAFCVISGGVEGRRRVEREDSHLYCYVAVLRQEGYSKVRMRGERRFGPSLYTPQNPYIIRRYVLTKLLFPLEASNYLLYKETCT